MWNYSNKYFYWLGLAHQENSIVLSLAPFKDALSLKFIFYAVIQKIHGNSHRKPLVRHL